MFKLFLVTHDFMEPFLKEEINSLIGIEPKLKEEGLFELFFESESVFLENALKIIHFSRSVDYLFLEILNFKDILEIKKSKFDFFKKNFSFFLDSFDDSLNIKKLEEISKIIEKKNLNLKFDLEFFDLEFEIFKTLDDNFHLCFNLFGDSLTKREYKVNSFEDSINPLFVNYLLFKLGIDKLNKFSFIDTNAELGDIIIETSLFNPRKALFVKEKRSLPISKVFTLPLGMVFSPKDNNKYLAVVLDNNNFKYLKENITFSSQKIKVSLFDLDWLDIKFHKGDFDFLITQFPDFDEGEEQIEYEKEFFYQSEFITKNEICIFSKNKLFLNCLKEFNLNLISKEKLVYEDNFFYLYIIKK